MSSVGDGDGDGEGEGQGKPRGSYEIGKKDKPVVMVVQLGDLEADLEIAGCSAHRCGGTSSLRQ